MDKKFPNDVNQSFNQEQDAYLDKLKEAYLSKIPESLRKDAFKPGAIDPQHITNEFRNEIIRLEDEYQSMAAESTPKEQLKAEQEEPEKKTPPANDQPNQEEPSILDEFSGGRVRASEQSAGEGNFGGLPPVGFTSTHFGTGFRTARVEPVTGGAASFFPGPVEAPIATSERTLDGYFASFGMNFGSAVGAPGYQRLQPGTGPLLNYLGEDSANPAFESVPVDQRMAPDAGLSVNVLWSEVNGSAFGAAPVGNALIQSALTFIAPAPATYPAPLGGATFIPLGTHGQNVSIDSEMQSLEGTVDYLFPLSASGAAAGMHAMTGLVGLQLAYSDLEHRITQTDITDPRFNMQTNFETRDFFIGPRFGIFVRPQNGPVTLDVGAYVSPGVLFSQGNAVQQVNTPVISGAITLDESQSAFAYRAGLHGSLTYNFASNIIGGITGGVELQNRSGAWNNTLVVTDQPASVSLEPMTNAFIGAFIKIRLGGATPAAN